MVVSQGGGCEGGGLYVVAVSVSAKKALVTSRRFQYQGVGWGVCSFSHASRCGFGKL